MLTEWGMEAGGLEAWKAGFQIHTGTQKKRHIQSLLFLDPTPVSALQITYREGLDPK